MQGWLRVKIPFFVVLFISPRWFDVGCWWWNSAGKWHHCSIMSDAIVHIYTSLPYKGDLEWKFPFWVFVSFLHPSFHTEWWNSVYIKLVIQTTTTTCFVIYTIFSITLFWVCKPVYHLLRVTLWSQKFSVCIKNMKFSRMVITIQNILKVHGYLVAGFYEIWHANDYIIVTSETFITTMKNGQFYELEFCDIYLINVYLIVQVKQK